MSVRWAILAILLVLAINVVLIWGALRFKRKAILSAAERKLANGLRAQQRAVDKELSHRPPVRAGTLPTVTPTTLKGKS